MSAPAAALRFRPPSSPLPDELTVLDITEWYGETSGGVRTYLQQKGEYVKRRSGLRQVLVVPGPDDAFEHDGNVRRYQLRGPRIPTQQQYRFLLATRTLRRIVLTEQPDVIEVGSQMLVPWLARLAARGTHARFVAFHHTNLERLMVGGTVAPHWRRAIREPLRLYMRRLDAMVDASIAASDSLECDLRRAGIEHITRIPLGVDLDLFHPRRAAAAPTIRALLHLPADAPLVAYVGRMAREKQLGVLIDAWKEMERHTSAWLALVGDGPLTNELRLRARGLRVRFLPFQPDRHRVAELLAAASVFVAPGPMETFGLAPLEALACATPVLAADQGAVAELVERSGAGATFRSGSAESLATALRMLLTINHDALGRLGRRYAEQAHGWDAVFDRVFDLYRGLIRR